MENLKKRIIGEQQSTKGIVIECNNSSSFAIVKYTSYNKRFHPEVLLIEDYETMLDYPISSRVKKIKSLVGTYNFKIRRDAFDMLFVEISEYVKNIEEDIFISDY